MMSSTAQWSGSKPGSTAPIPAPQRSLRRSPSVQTAVSPAKATGGTTLAAPAAEEVVHEEVHKLAVRHTPLQIFVCDEESHFYSQVLEKLLLRNCRDSRTRIIEFGAGDGTPVINALLRGASAGCNFGDSVVHGYELNPRAAAVASRKAAQMGVAHQYKVHNSCFFKGAASMDATWLIANPPYIPAEDDSILMPALHGGEDGANLTRDLMTLGFDNMVLLLSAYSNPIETIEHARRQGYRVTDFMVTPLPFGYYSSEPKACPVGDIGGCSIQVRTWIEKMKGEGKAFFARNTYLLAGALLQLPARMEEGSTDDDVAPRTPQHSGNIVPSPRHARRSPRKEEAYKGRKPAVPCSAMADDLTDELIAVMTALK